MPTQLKSDLEGTYSPVFHQVVIKNPSVPVFINEGAKEIIITRMGNLKAETTIDADAEQGNTTVSVSDSTGFEALDSVFISEDGHFEQATIVSVAGQVLTIDTPLSRAFASGSYIGCSNVNMAVDGSVNPVKFNLRTGQATPSVVVIVSKLVLVLETQTKPQLDEFGDLQVLNRGVFLRRVSGEVITPYFNIKSNIQTQGMACNVEYFDGGKNKTYSVTITFDFDGMGSGIVLQPEEDLELWVNDDITNLLSMSAVIRGTYSLA